MIKISIVSYSNTIPFLYGLNKWYFNNEINVSLDDPSTCAKKLISNKVDIGLIPVVSIKMIKDPKIISNYCIGADGYVDTVCIYSDIPINEVENIFIDSDSETSVKLLMILLKEYWKVHPNLIRIKIKNEVLLQKKSTALVIGDKTFSLRDKYKYVYDLSSIWKKLTGLPFVFALWVTNKNLDNKFLSQFNLALSFGVKNIQEAISFFDYKFNHKANLEEYLNNRISYDLDVDKKKSLKYFLEKLRVNGF